MIMIDIVFIILLVAFSFQVFPVALGLRAGEPALSTALGAFVLIAIQVLLLWLGYLAGNAFTYLVAGFDKAILFMGFLLIGVRFIMEVFKIRRGERTYQIDNISSAGLAALGQGINTFLLGILCSLIETDILANLIILGISASVLTIAGILSSPHKLTLTFASFLYLTGGIVILFAGAFFTFV